MPSVDPPIAQAPTMARRAAPGRSAEPRAVLLAELLHARFGAGALALAEGRRVRAAGDGRIGRGDLYRAVCTILGSGCDEYARLHHRFG